MPRESDVRSVPMAFGIMQPTPDFMMTPGSELFSVSREHSRTALQQLTSSFLRDAMNQISFSYLRKSQKQSQEMASLREEIQALKKRLDAYDEMFEKLNFPWKKPFLVILNQLGLSSVVFHVMLFPVVPV